MSCERGPISGDDGDQLVKGARNWNDCPSPTTYQETAEINVSLFVGVAVSKVARLASLAGHRFDLGSEIVRTVERDAVGVRRSERNRGRPMTPPAGQGSMRALSGLTRIELLEG